MQALSLNPLKCFMLWNEMNWRVKGLTTLGSPLVSRDFSESNNTKCSENNLITFSYTTTDATIGANST